MTPFAPDIWPAAKRDAATALWAFYHAIDQSPATWRESETPGREARPVAARAYATCETYRLDRALLEAQMQAASQLVSPVRFATAADLMDFVRMRCGSHAQLLAQLAGERGEFKLRGIREFAKALFLTKRLCQLPQDVQQDRLFIPMAELEQFGGIDVSAQRRPDGQQGDAAVVEAGDPHTGCLCGLSAAESGSYRMVPVTLPALRDGRAVPAVTGRAQKV